MQITSLICRKYSLTYGFPFIFRGCLCSHSIYFALVASVLFQLSGCTLSHYAILHIRPGQTFQGRQYGQALLNYNQAPTSSKD